MHQYQHIVFIYFDFETVLLANKQKIMKINLLEFFLNNKLFNERNIA
jgi:hypothetical protein